MYTYTIHEYINIYIYILYTYYTYIYIYWASISPRHQPSVWRAGGWPWRAGGRADGENWAPTCANLSLLLHNVTPHIILQASGNASWKLPELRKTEYLLQASGKASGNLPGPSGTAAKKQNHKTSFRQASGNLPGPSGTATEMKMTGQASGNASGNLPGPSGTLVILTSTF